MEYIFLNFRRVRRALPILLVAYASHINLALADWDDGAQVGNSIYQFDSSWKDQNNRTIKLDALAGNKQLVAFVYSYCEHTCPLIIAQIKAVLAELSEADKNSVRVTLISLDPARDTPDQLHAYMQKNKLDDKQWTMLAGDPDDVRVLANIFGVKYKPMQQDEIAHSNMITLVDSDGVIQAQLKGLHQDKSLFIQQILAR